MICPNCKFNFNGNYAQVASENVCCPSCDEKVLNEETPEPIGDLPNAVDFQFLRNEKKNRVI